MTEARGLKDSTRGHTDMESSGDNFDAIVVGGGIMGSCTAYHLARRGHRTLLLEQFDFLHLRGSSHGESRTIRATYPEPYYQAMVMESAQLWREAEAEIGYQVYFETSQLDIGPSDSKSLQAVIANCGANAVSHRILDHRQMTEQLSGRIGLPENWVGLFTELGGVLKPTKAVSMFLALALKHGAMLKDNTEVRDIKRDGKTGDIAISTARRERFHCKKCVVTVGAWTQKLVKAICGLVIPIQPLETTVCYWKIKDGFQAQYTIDANFPTFASYGDPYIYGTPSFELPGLVKIAVHGGRPCDPDERSWAPGALVGLLKEWIEGRFLGRVDSQQPVATQSCVYSMTPDEDFVIDFLGREFGKDVMVGGGFSGHGFKMGPVVGRILADLVVNGEAHGVELKHFRLGRFEESPKGNVKEFEDQVQLGVHSL